MYAEGAKGAEDAEKRGDKGKMMKGNRLRLVGGWGVWVCVGVLIFVGLLPMVSYGEATVVGGVRLNWWVGNIAMMWGKGSGVRGEFVSLDEFFWEWGFSWGHFSYVWGRLQLPSALFVAVGIVGIAVFWCVRFRFWMVRLGLETVECGSCGYSLEGLDGGVCPECGVGEKGEEKEVGVGGR